MRSTLVHFSLVALPLALAGGVVVAACGGDDASPRAFRNGGANEEPTASGAPGGGFNSGTDASADNKETYRGSPLCGVVPGECSPDDDGQRDLPNGATACAAPADDADGPPDASSLETSTEGCRVVAKSDQSYVPDCVSADRRGVDGVSCQKGSDCAPGFDCVEGEKGSVCRRYCCAGTCEGHPSQNGGPTFCDIRKPVEYSDHKIPVCMPLKTCKLLRDGECGEKETCAIVTGKGESGCVPKGNANVGESCDKDNCNSGLTCLGSPGDRRCYKLCRVDGADCGPMQTCTTGSVFQDTTFGVCNDD